MTVALYCIVFHRFGVLFYGGARQDDAKVLRAANMVSRWVGEIDRIIYCETMLLAPLEMVSASDDVTIPSEDVGAVSFICINRGLYRK